MDTTSVNVFRVKPFKKQDPVYRVIVFFWHFLTPDSCCGKRSKICIEVSVEA